MADCIQIAENSLREILSAAMDKISPEGTRENIAFNIEIPADKAHGDFSSNIAMVSAKTLHASPRSIAERLLDVLDMEGTTFERAEIAGPGFMNFFLKKQWFSGVVETVLDEGGDYGRTKTGEGKRALVEFVSANPTGPMHIGNARGGALGDSLAEILTWTGWDVQREFYINDAGNQIEKFATSLEVRYLQLYDPTVTLPEDAYHGEDITDHAKAFAKLYGDKYVTGDSKERRDALVNYALPKNIEGLERDLRGYRIVYDNWYRESSLHESGKVKWVIDELTRRGYTYEKDGATWFTAEKFGADKDFVLVRANGIPTYVVPDIAYHYDKLMVRRFDKAIDVLGADHHGYVPRLKAALTALGADADRLDVVLMQMVMLVRDGEVIKFSKRSGKAITLVTLLEEIPLDAARFFFNTRRADSHFEFDLDLAVEKTSQNPVYYVQYAHARICSILRTLAEDGVTVAESNRESLLACDTPQEIELIRHLATLPRELDAAAAAYDPSRLTKYAITLATLFHKFYDACSIRYAQSSVEQQGRLLLCEAVRIVLENVLGILKVSAPEKM